MSQSFTQHSFDIGQQILSGRSNISRKDNGQFLTPPPLAKYMSAQVGDIHNGDRILDPAMGSGTLVCALIDRLVAENRQLEVWIDGFEIDKELFQAAQSILKDAIIYANQYNIQINLNLFQIDYVLNGLHHLKPSLLETPVGHQHYQHIIANPPYFKINTSDPRRQAAEGLLSGHTNIYTLFMGLAAKMLHNGQATFIVPRSFCSGTYFKHFRREFLSQVIPRHIHLFEARDDAFGGDDVLQENLVIAFAPHGNEQPLRPILISSSSTIEDLTTTITPRAISLEQFVSPSGLFRLPTSDIDDLILKAIDRWAGSLNAYGMEISTGPVVPFRSKPHLIHKPDEIDVVPLLWMQHVKPHQVIWPLNNTFRKPQYVRNRPLTKHLLVKNTNLILLRRFSAKEEFRRLIAAPYLAQNFDYEFVGLENHLNYIYHRNRHLSEEEVIGLTALLNSGLIDRYFRISNGNTQVNATEIRDLPLPPLDVIVTMGQSLITQSTDPYSDLTVMEILQTCGLLPEDFPTLYETKVR